MTLRSYLLFIPLALGLSAQAWADTNAEKIRFVRGLYTEQARHYDRNTGHEVGQYKDAVEKYADTQLAAAYKQARDYDRRLERVQPHSWEIHCLGGGSYMFGGAEEPELNIRRDYSVMTDGRVKVKFNLTHFLESKTVTVYYTLRRHGRSFRVVDMEIKFPTQDRVWHTPSYRDELNRCVRNLRREFRLG
ncbi:hypothetical protein [Neisseria shayeganii]|uniref:Periplasmic protein n=1 Tax=Neisseria shayeganii 871 TaxID=1032488 RepID=G4CFZ3_9NEIS|nr:hypothetical protein [Neisseria shayeganii]EGY53234.1 hypothetical protein HMPREF9371_0532 [Neisseria shayeganii 871]